LYIKKIGVNIISDLGGDHNRRIKTLFMKGDHDEKQGPYFHFIFGCDGFDELARGVSRCR
jgi:hypothetical protein